MTERFAHREFRTYPIDLVPVDRDLFMMDERWMSDYETAMVDFFNGQEYRHVGYVSYVGARRAGADRVELSWYPNLLDRFHEVSITLPRDAFVVCVDCPRYDEKPHVFVKSAWLSDLHLRPYSAFALVDAIGVRDAIARGELGSRKLEAISQTCRARRSR